MALEKVKHLHTVIYMSYICMSYVHVHTLSHTKLSELAAVTKVGRLIAKCASERHAFRIETNFALLFSVCLSFFFLSACACVCVVIAPLLYRSCITPSIDTL